MNNRFAELADLPESEIQPHDVALAMLSPPQMCPRHARYGQDVGRAVTTKLYKFGPTEDVKKFWMARTIDIREVDGTIKHLLFPFIINSGGVVMIGDIAYQRCIDCGAHTGTTLLDDVLLNASMILPSKPSYRFIRHVPPGNWVDVQPDIRNNIIGSEYAAMIFGVAILADLVRDDAITTQQALQRLAATYPGTTPESFEPELSMHMSSPSTDSMVDAVERLFDE
uniref:Uncharacterized protein n=1 Tax=Spongospora subterranea TaxID=70186 RepID=A0A0H5RT58_9EUKA|eukprot:CRZ11919.1 hypothetical protein [Spongospora subterranea]